MADSMISRMLALRQFPLFASADVNDLVTLAENVVERRFAAGARVTTDHTLQLVVDGTLACGEVDVATHDVLGWKEALAEQHVRCPAIALVPTRTLEIDAADYIDVLEDSFSLLLATIRDLAAQVAALGHTTDHVTLPPGVPLGLAERMVVFRQLFPLEAARLDPLAILAQAATETRWSRGEEITQAGALVVLAGKARVGEHVLGAGDAVGLVEALADASVDATAVTDVRVLEIRAATLRDVLEDHTDVALAIARVLGEVLLGQRKSDRVTRSLAC